MAGGVVSGLKTQLTEDGVTGYRTCYNCSETLFVTWNGRGTPQVWRWQHGPNPEHSFVIEREYMDGESQRLLSGWLDAIHRREVTS